MSSSITSSELPVVLVACCGPKLARPAPAAELYISDLFRKSRAWAERFGARWFILSAAHGLVEPDQVLAPYDVTLADQSPADRRAWNDRVLGQLQAAGVDLQAPLVMLAGVNYRGWADLRLQARSAPMAGLGIGQQKAWLKAQLASA